MDKKKSMKWRKRKKIDRGTTWEKRKRKGRMEKRKDEEAEEERQTDMSIL